MSETEHSDGEEGEDEELVYPDDEDEEIAYPDDDEDLRHKVG